MADSTRVLLSIVFIAFVGSGVLYLTRPLLIQKMVLKRMQRRDGWGVTFVSTPAFLWFIRAVGLALIAIGVRGLFTSGALHG